MLFYVAIKYLLTSQLKRARGSKSFNSVNF